MIRRVSEGVGTKKKTLAPRSTPRAETPPHPGAWEVGSDFQDWVGGALGVEAGGGRPEE